MSELSVQCRLGTHLSDEQRSRAAELLSYAYTKWQNNPQNTDPVKTDTSLGVYDRLLRRGIREVVMVFDHGEMVAVFVHSLSPQYDQYPLRKLSFLGARPTERGFDPLQDIFRTYAGYVSGMGEDVCCTTDLDQGTLNSLLTNCGFREVMDRNEIYYILSQLLSRKVVSSQKVQGDFVVDEIISVDGKAVRRDKKLLIFENAGTSPYQTYLSQQRIRLERSLPEANWEVLSRSLEHAQDGIFFISDYVNTITQPDPAKGGFDSQAAVFGPGFALDPSGLMDPEQGLVWMRPGDEEAMRAVAGQVVLRPGFFDFLSYCFRVLGSFCVTTGVTPVEVSGVLERCLHRDIQLTFRQMVEAVLVPEAEPVAGTRRAFADGLERTAWRFSGPYVEPSGAVLRTRKEAMMETLLGYRGTSRAPVVCLGCRATELSGIRRLFEESERTGLPVLLLDFGQQLTLAVHDELFRGRPQDHPCFSVVNVRDFYQVPVILECLGLCPEPGVEFAVG